jgi:hypothetical protein
MSHTESKADPEHSVWIWRDQFHYPQVSFKRPPSHIAAHEYVRIDIARATLQTLHEALTDEEISHGT